MQSPPQDAFDDDLLEGGEQIAAFAKKPYRKVVYMLRKGQLPGYKVGHVWFARRSKMRSRLLGDDQGAR